MREKKVVHERMYHTCIHVTVYILYMTMCKHTIIHSLGLQVTFVCWSVKSATRASLDLNSCSYSHEDF